MQAPQKTRYALRALFELAKRYGTGPSKISDIAQAQAIPPRFLEVILSQLKSGGFVDAKRGSEGGYYLVTDPADLSVGDIIKFMDGPIGPVDCIDNSERENCPFYGSCVFLPMWDKVKESVEGIYDSTSFKKLVERDAENQAYIPMYCI